MSSVNYCRIVDVVLHRADIFRAEEGGNTNFYVLLPLFFVLKTAVLGFYGKLLRGFGGLSRSRAFLCRKEKKKTSPVDE